MTTFTGQRSAVIAATGVLALLVVSLAGIDAEQAAPPASSAQARRRGAVGPALFAARRCQQGRRRHARGDAGGIFRLVCRVGWQRRPAR